MQIFYVIIASFFAPLPVTARYIHFVEDIRGFRVPFNTGTGGPLEERETTVGVNSSVVIGAVIEPLIRNDTVKLNADVSKAYTITNKDEPTAVHELGGLPGALAHTLDRKDSPEKRVREKREDSVSITKYLKDQNDDISAPLDDHVGVDFTAGNPSSTSTPGPRNPKELVTTAPRSKGVKVAGAFMLLFVLLYVAHLLWLMLKRYCGCICPIGNYSENMEEFEFLPL